MPIGLPTPEVAWNYSLLNRIAYTSVNQVCAESIYTIATRLIAQGWIVKGSCDGIAGAMDGVNRWTDYTKAATRFNGAAGAQSWIVLTDGDGADIVFSYNSAADDRYNYWWSPTGVAVAAGTPAQEPTAADQNRLNAFFTTAPPTTVSGTAAGDRLVSIWTTADGKSFRVAIARANGWVCLLGKEQFSAASLGAGVNLHPGYAFFIGGGLTAGTTRSLINAPVSTVGAAEQFRAQGYRVDGGGQILEIAREAKVTGQSNVTVSSPTTFMSTALALQGGAIYGMRRLSLFSITVGHEGSVGKMRDWWTGRLGVNDGDTYGANDLIVVNGSWGIVWPWDGATPVVMS